LGKEQAREMGSKAKNTPKENAGYHPKYKGHLQDT
jgi:hypothetical protein